MQKASGMKFQIQVNKENTIEQTLTYLIANVYFILFPTNT
jgi:hypothetical protein